MLFRSVTWPPQPLPTQPLDFLPLPEIIRDRLAADFTQLLTQPAFIDYQARQPQLEALSLSYITQALEKLGWSPKLGEALMPPSIAEQLTIAPQQQQLFQYLLSKVEGNREQGTGNREQGEPRPQKLKQGEPRPQNLEPNHPERVTQNEQPTTQNEQPSAYPPSPELALLNRCGENLAAVLQGEVDPLTLLFPHGDLSDLTQLYERSPGAQVMNTLVQRAVTTAITQAQRPLRILEIGAGTGGTTADRKSVV